jgi:uncharacterized protein YxjI
METRERSLVSIAVVSSNQSQFQAKETRMRNLFGLKSLSVVLGLALLAVGMTGCSSSPHKPEAVAGPATPAPSLPASFEIVEKLSMWGNKFDVRANGQVFGRITEEVFSWGRTFRYVDSEGRLVATAHAKPLSWGVNIEVFDSTGAKIGTIKEDLSWNLLRQYTVYHIHDRTGKEVAVSKKYQFLSTDINLTHPTNGKQIANINRAMFNLFGDTWRVTVANSEGVDPRLLVMISAFKTAEDNAKSDE